MNTINKHRLICEYTTKYKQAYISQVKLKFNVIIYKYYCMNLCTFLSL